MSTPLTILIPAFNAARYLRVALDSLLAQTYTKWECYLLDDGSQDQTFAIAQEYAARDSRFQVFQQANQGASKTRNTLLNKITTPYFAFLDADDLIHPRTFEEAIRLLDTTQVDIVEYGIHRVPETFKQSDIAAIPSFSPPQILKDLACYQTRSLAINGWINQCNKVYRTACVHDIRFDAQLVYEEDFWFNVRVHANCQSKAIIKHVLYYYRTSIDSLTTKINFDDYVKSGTRRIWLSHAFFIEEHRLLPQNRTAYEKDITIDAFRMVLQKHLKKNWTWGKCYPLFCFAAEELKKMVDQKVIFPQWLNRRKRFALWCATHKHYILCRIAVLLASI